MTEDLLFCATLSKNRMRSQTSMYLVIIKCTTKESSGVEAPTVVTLLPEKTVKTSRVFFFKKTATKMHLYGCKDFLEAINEQRPTNYCTADIQKILQKLGWLVIQDFKMT